MPFEEREPLRVVNGHGGRASGRGGLFHYCENWREARAWYAAAHGLPFEGVLVHFPAQP